MRLCKEKGRHSREGENPVFLLFLVKSTGNELDPRFRVGDENPNLATNKFNNLRPYLSAYGVYPRPRLLYESGPAAQRSQNAQNLLN
jgi:hypothetical protein